jgi:DNA-binding transcriptional MerR regulator
MGVCVCAIRGELVQDRLHPLIHGQPTTLDIRFYDTPDNYTSQKHLQRLEQLGLTLADAKQLLTIIHQHLLEQQGAALNVAERCEEELGEKQWFF